MNIFAAPGARAVSSRVPLGYHFISNPSASLSAFYADFVPNFGATGSRNSTREYRIHSPQQSVHGTSPPSQRCRSCSDSPPVGQSRRSRSRLPLVGHMGGRHAQSRRRRSTIERRSHDHPAVAQVVADFQQSPCKDLHDAPPSRPCRPGAGATAPPIARHLPFRDGAPLLRPP